jgi:hypothetical protein
VGKNSNDYRRDTGILSACCYTYTPPTKDVTGVLREQGLIEMLFTGGFMLQALDASKE